MIQDNSPVIIATGQTNLTKHKRKSSSHGLNDFMEGATHDINELYRVVSNNLITLRRVEDIVDANLDSLQEQIASLSLSDHLPSLTLAVEGSAYAYNGEDYGVVLIPKNFRGMTDFYFSARSEAHLMMVVGGATLPPSSLLKDVPVFFNTIGLVKVSLYNGATWDELQPTTSIPTDPGLYYYKTTTNEIYLHPDHIDKQAKLESPSTGIFWDSVDTLIEVGSDTTPMNRYWYNRADNIIVVNKYLVGASVLVDILPITQSSRLNAPADEVFADFFVDANAWITANASLAGMNSNVRYRIHSTSAGCRHDSTYGQITLPVISEENKLIANDRGDVLVPDSLKVNTRIFTIHNKITSDGGYYYNPVNADNPFRLDYMLQRVRSFEQGADSFANPEIYSEEIPMYFDQSDPLYAVDGRLDTPAWMLSQYADLNMTHPMWENDRSHIPDYPISHLIVFYDITIPEDLRSHMMMNTIQVHTLPVFKSHLIGVFYETGDGFDLDSSGRSFHMLQGIGGAGLPNLRDYPESILGAGTNIFWNASFLELHVKKTECNHLRLVFAVPYDPLRYLRRNVIVGASHIGVYYRKYKETGSFQIEFDPSAGFDLNSLGTDSQAWVNNKYALFVPDPKVNPNFASVSAVSSNRVQVDFGIRTNDLTGTTRAFDNSATPSFNGVKLS